MPKGGHEHTKAQQIIMEHFRAAGMIAIIEGYIGRHVDVLVLDPARPGVVTAIEYQRTEANALRNISGDFEAGCEQVIIVSSKRQVLKRIQLAASRILIRKQYERVEFRLLEEFIPSGLRQTNLAE